MSRGLVRRIFDELFAMGALQNGDLVVDPFNGIGSTGIEAAYRGLRYIGVELEPKFVHFTQMNYAWHEPQWKVLGYPAPVVVQGDSRRLREVIGPALAGAVVGSPPYAHANGSPSLGHPERDGMPGGDILKRCTTGARPGDERYGHTEGQLGEMREGRVDAVISSPPYAEIASGAGGLNTKPPKHEGQQGGRSPASPSQDTDQRYGESEGQLARLPKGEVDTVISSPPYAGSLDDGGPERAHPDGYRRSNDWSGYGSTEGQLGKLKDSGVVDTIVSSPPFPQPYTGGGGINVKGYGADGADKVGDRTYQGRGAERTKGNLETMAPGAVDAVVSSPPYEGSLHHGEDGIDWEKAKNGNDGGTQTKGVSVTASMESSPENLGNQSKETFWSAALEIVLESYAVLKPGGMAVWVVKRFVRDGQIQPFDDDWRRLCEHVGFTTVQEVHASLVHREEHDGLFGPIVKTTARKSFFRRLYESRHPENAIDYETVLFMVKR